MVQHRTGHPGTVVVWFVDEPLDAAGPAGWEWMPPDSSVATLSRRTATTPFRFSSALPK